MGRYGYREILKRIDEDDMVRICTELIRFRSVNPPGNELEIPKLVDAARIYTLTAIEFLT